MGRWELLRLPLRWKLGSWPTCSDDDMMLDKVVDYIKREYNISFVSAGSIPVNLSLWLQIKQIEWDGG
ncbi:hypothetical protein Tco_0872855 [Tanacetum coccineum]